MKNIGYGTPVMILAFDEFHDMQKHVANAILPKMGVNRKAARAVVFSTGCYGGLGL
jgi:hypothetical protein